MSVLSVQNLSVEIETQRGVIHPVKNLSVSLEPGSTLGIVGESGCGKSLTSLAIMGLLPSSAKAHYDRLILDGKDLNSIGNRQRRLLRGTSIAMIFQDPLTSLNPSFTVEFQLGEAIRRTGLRKKTEVKGRAISLLERVGIPDPESRLSNYPHQLSGGMAQRVMIAMALASKPKVLIADEPTTALDVTIQSQILALLKEIQKEEDMALILISHDLGVVAQVSDEIAVMYAGEIVEYGPVEDVVAMPSHPYTEGLLACLPQEEYAHKAHLPNIPGLVPDLAHRPPGCQFGPRCSYADEFCKRESLALSTFESRSVRCLKPIAATGGQNA